MSCKSCQSPEPGQFLSGSCDPLPGLKGLDKPVVWVFPKPLVCLDCGFTEFAVPERELRVLVQGSPVEGAVVWPESSLKA